MRCKKCGEEKCETEFYKAKGTKTGYHGSCKVCMNAKNKKYVSENQAKVKAYKREHYLKNKVKYDTKTKNWFYENQGKYTEYSKNWQVKNPVKRDAHNKVNYALKTGALIKSLYCECCGVFTESLHGHHDDYSKPLEVRWLCTQCHADWHHNNVAEGC